MEWTRTQGRAAAAAVVAIIAGLTVAQLSAFGIHNVAGWEVAGDPPCAELFQHPKRGFMDGLDAVV